MAFCCKLLGVLLLLVVISLIQAQPVEESKAVTESDDEIMETAAGGHPFLPRFAMRRLKERRDKDKAQRRNHGVQGQRRNQYYGGYQGGWRQPYGVSCPHYKK